MNDQTIHSSSWQDLSSILQNEVRVKDFMGDVPSDVAHLLGPNEQVELYIQQKIYHPKINVDSVVLTNERVILRHPHAMRLKKDYTDFSYTDIANAILDKGVLRSTKWGQQARHPFSKPSRPHLKRAQSAGRKMRPARNSAGPAAPLSNPCQPRDSATAPLRPELTEQLLGLCEKPNNLAN